MNWSGGKDSSLCLEYLLQHDEFEVVGLLTSVNEQYGRVSMHGIRQSLVRAQANQLDIPLHWIRIPGTVTMEEYNQLMLDTLRPFYREGITHCAFGDIFLEDLRAYREEKLQQVGIRSLFPLWGRPTRELACKFIDDGFKALISSTDGSKLDSTFVGREFDTTFLEDLPTRIDPCGEYGAFHSFVYDGPIFNEGIEIERGEVVERVYKNRADNIHSDYCSSTDSEHSAFWYVDLELSTE